MKTISTLILLVVCQLALPLNALCQDGDANQIQLAAVVSETIDGLTPAIESNLKNKLNQIASKNGMGASSSGSRFIIAANVQVLDKVITPTAPPMHTYSLEVSLYIGDGIDGTLFSNTSVNLKGVGETETKAYLAALKNLNSNDPTLQSFIGKAKEKIIAYYNANCDRIIKEAEVVAGRNDYDAALYKLSAIPMASSSCFDKAANVMKSIYKNKIDRECQMKLQKAEGYWNASQNMDGANQAAEVMSSIDPSAACFSEVKSLNARIAKKINEIDERGWKYILKEQAQESERIAAIRAIGVAYGNNQPQNITYNYRGWW